MKMPVLQSLIVMPLTHMTVEDSIILAADSLIIHLSITQN